MALINFKKDQKQIDDGNELMCSVPGCNNRWTVHISGDKPKCSHHQWSKNPQEYRRPIVAKPISQAIKHWSETENDGEAF
jgi:hypothetical protein